MTSEEIPSSPGARYSLAEQGEPEPGRLVWHESPIGRDINEHAVSKRIPQIHNDQLLAVLCGSIQIRLDLNLYPRSCFSHERCIRCRATPARLSFYLNDARFRRDRDWPKRDRLWQVAIGRLLRTEPCNGADGRCCD